MTCQREWHATCEVRQVHGGHIDNYRAVIQEDPEYPPWMDFMYGARPLAYTDSYATRVKGVWAMNEAQGAMRAQECFCSELVADAYIEFKVFENANTNDILPVHYAEDDGRVQHFQSGYELLGSAKQLPWNVEDVDESCHLGPPLLMLPPSHSLAPEPAHHMVH